MDSPFLDVLTCMTEAELLLTQLEYEEWGDPRDPAAARVIQERCPYQGIPAGPQLPQYPPVLITYGQGDERVPEWGPLKWAARVRASQSGPASDQFGGGAERVSDRGRAQKTAGPVVLARRQGGGHFPTEADAGSRAALVYAFLDKALAGNFDD